MSQRASRSTRHSVYVDDGPDATPDHHDSATELRDSQHGTAASNNNNNYGSSSPSTPVGEPEQDSHHDKAFVEKVATALQHDDSELTWTDRDGTVYRYVVNPLLTVCPFVLIQELCERLAYYGLTPTLKPFLKKTLNVGDAEASSLMGLFQGVLFLTPIVSAALADSFLGIYSTILYFSIVYACGLGLMEIAAIESISSPWMVYVALFVLICVGAGGIKSCVNVFGAQQFHPTAQKELITSYFSYFYASINVGSLIGGIACPQVQHDVSFAAAYLIPLCSFVVALMVFVSGTNRYLRFKPQGSPVVGVAKVLVNAVKLKSFQATKKSNGGDQDDGFVEDTLQLLKLQPLCALAVPMLIAYNQMSTAFLSQSEKLRNLIFGSEFAPALMQNVDAISVITTSILVEKFLYPFLRRRNIMPSVIARFAIGNSIAVFALICAYIVEIEVMTQEKPFTVSIWVQFPQFALIAVAEIFVISTSYEVAFTMAPQRLKAVASACNLLWFSLAGFISGLLFIICSSWMPDFDPHRYATYQQAHYNYYFLVLASLCGFGVLFCLALRGYFFGLIGGRSDEKNDEEVEAEGVAQEGKNNKDIAAVSAGAEEVALLDDC